MVDTLKMIERELQELRNIMPTQRNDYQNKMDSQANIMIFGISCNLASKITCRLFPFTSFPFSYSQKKQLLG